MKKATFTIVGMKLESEPGISGNAPREEKKSGRGRKPKYSPLSHKPYILVNNYGRLVGAWNFYDDDTPDYVMKLDLLIAIRKYYTQKKNDLARYIKDYEIWLCDNGFKIRYSTYRAIMRKKLRKGEITQEKYDSLFKNQTSERKQLRKREKGSTANVY